MDTYQWFRNENYRIQMLHAEQMQQKMIERLIAEGYVNTIHDCWEKVEPHGD